MISIPRIKALYPLAEISEWKDGILIFSYPAKPWVDVPSRGDLSHKCGAKYCRQVGSARGRVIFNLEPMT
jgi:hypothetical protein